LGELSGRWARTAGSPSDPEYLATLIAELRGLARRAKEDGRLIYCWMSL
jgi:hypothetical protein